MNMLAKKILCLSTLTVSTLVLLFIVLAGSTHALSGNDFKPGRIIDDAVFFNRNAMNADQIQAFLDAKVPACDTNGTQPYAGTTRANYGSSRGYPPPYTCLKDYTQNITSITNGGSDLCTGSISGGTRSAAQIIYSVSQACGINPQVMLVLLQKEQSLVTDVWPWSIQYRSATGYGCPDTAPCDSEYYGFFNQVYQAAKAFRRYEANPNGYNYRAGRNNYIYYHPSLGSCGGTNVFIENQATANLYIYTPYQPNQAALNNLYGTGDGCSAYGNRNFWRMFNDWFGPTTGSLIRSVSSATLYFSDGERKYVVPSMSIAEEFGLSLSDVRFLSQQEMNAIPSASSPFSSSLETLVKSESDSDDDGSTVYLVSNGFRYAIPSMGVFNSYGFDSSEIRYISLQAINRLYPSSKNLSTLAKGSNSTVYKIESSKKRTIFELSKLTELNSAGNISSLSQFALNRMPYGTPMVDGDYVVSKGHAIRLYNGSSFTSVPSLGTYSCWNLQNIKRFKVGSFDITNGSNSGNLSCVGQNNAGNAYIANGSTKIALSPGHGITATTVSQSLLDSLANSPLKPILKGSSSTLALYENNELRVIPNMTVFFDLGYTSSDIGKIPGSVFSIIPKGPQLLSPGTLVTGDNDKSVYVVNSENEKVAIPSAGMFNGYSFVWNKIVTAPQSTLDYYSTDFGLSHSVLSSGNAYIVDSKTKFLIDPSLDTHIGINRASLNTLQEALIANLPNKSMTRFVKSNSSSTIFYLENGTRRPISSWSTLQSLGGEGKIITLSDSYLATIPAGTNL